MGEEKGEEVWVGERGGGKRLADPMVFVCAARRVGPKKTRLRVSRRCVQVRWDGVFDRPPEAAERNYSFPADEGPSWGGGGSTDTGSSYQLPIGGRVDTRPGHGGRSLITVCVSVCVQQQQQLPAPVRGCSSAPFPPPTQIKPSFFLLFPINPFSFFLSPNV